MEKALALLEIFTEGINDSADWGRKTTKAERCEECSDLRREIFEETRSSDGGVLRERSSHGSEGHAGKGKDSRESHFEK